MEMDKRNTALERLKADLAAKTPAILYVFYGEESYLREHYIGQLSRIAGESQLSDFNQITLDGDQLDAERLLAAIDGIPWGAERKLVLVRDYPLFKPTGTLKDRLGEVLSTLPEYICLVFSFDALEFKPDKRSSIWKTVDKYGLVVEFPRAQTSELVSWLKRRFQALGKRIDTKTCEYMLFYCGPLMTNLITETDKIASGTQGEEITRREIDQLASRVLEADVFELTDHILKGNYARGLEKLRELFELKNEPVAVLGAVTRQFQRLYGAKLAMNARQGEREVMQLLGFHSPYPAKLLMDGAKGMKLPRLRSMQEMCLQADLEMKSNLPDPQRTAELLLLRLSNG